MSLDRIDVIRRFEPILYFHKDERFFPSDAKRYLEHCALWRVQGVPRDSKARWGGTSSRTFPHFPMIFRGKIVAATGESPRVSEAEDGMKGAFLGDDGFTTDTEAEERFLDLSGWIGGNVDETSSNRYANLDAIFALYQGGVQSLKDSRFWYHAEVFDAVRLRTLLDGRVLIDPEKFSILLKSFLNLRMQPSFAITSSSRDTKSPLKVVPIPTWQNGGQVAQARGAVSPSCSRATALRQTTNRR